MKKAPFSASGAICFALTGSGYRTELDDDLTRPRRMYQPSRALHDFLESLVGWQAGKNDVRLRADFSGRARRHAAELFELGKRTATIADDAITALDQISRDRHADLADADKANGLHTHLLRYFDRLIGKIDAQTQRALHDRPFCEPVGSQPVDDERIVGALR